MCAECETDCEDSMTCVSEEERWAIEDMWEKNVWAELMHNEEEAMWEKEDMWRIFSMPAS